MLAYMKQNFYNVCVCVCVCLCYRIHSSQNK